MCGHARLAQPLKPEQITNTVNLTKSPSWPIAKGRRPTERQRKRSNAQYTSVPLCMFLAFDALRRDTAKGKKKKSLWAHTETHTSSESKQKLFYRICRNFLY